MDPARLLSVAECRLVDRAAIDELGVPGVVLMENAGRGAVDELLRFDPGLCDGGRSVGILCGRGNNAGDGLVVARRLAVLGIPATVATLVDPRQMSGDAALNFRIAARLGLRIVDASALPADDEPGIVAALDGALAGAAWLVDALLGTGATGPLRPPLAAAVRWMNAQGARRLALDLPTGLDADAGTVGDPTVQADLTCTFVARKRGFVEPAARERLGEVRVVDIGVPWK
ncbi:MAG: NAD(P)H-hydrate epimerase [Pirellulales bacterium]|nr:NAD(P)H-hydrate epimerase [Pirellulales bacterium]